MSADDKMITINRAYFRQFQHNFFNRQPPFFGLGVKSAVRDISTVIYIYRGWGYNGFSACEIAIDFVNEKIRTNGIADHKQQSGNTLYIISVLQNLFEEHRYLLAWVD